MNALGAPFYVPGPDEPPAKVLGMWFTTFDHQRYKVLGADPVIGVTAELMDSILDGQTGPNARVIDDPGGPLLRIEATNGTWVYRVIEHRGEPDYYVAERVD